MTDLASTEIARYVASTTESKHGSAALHPAAHLAVEPRRLRRIEDIRQLKEDEIWRIHIADAIHIALDNAEFVRDRHQFLSPGNSLLANPGATPSAYDVLIRQTGGRGVDAALAAFDLQMATGAQWGQNALVQGNQFWTGSIPQSDILVSDTGSIYARLDKPLANGAHLSLVQNWNYTLNNLPSRSFNSEYAGFLRGEYRLPLWAGRGREFTTIAGPRSYRGQNSGRGVALAHIDEDLALIEFESRLHKLVKQTEALYWELWRAYQSYLSHRTAAQSAKLIWQRVQGRAAAGLDGGAVADEAQAAEHYFERKERADAALTELFQAEGRMRRLLGLPAGDARVLWPADEPTQAEFLFGWENALAGALAQRSELRQQKLRIRGLEMQLLAAKSLSHPQLDLVTGVQLNGVGNEIFGSSTATGTNAVDTLFDPDQVGWNVGFEFSMPFGFRLARGRVRNLQLRLAKARAALAAQEAEIGHELSYAVHNLDRWYASVQTTTERRSAAEKRLKAVEAEYQAGRTSLDQLLRSQIAMASAQLARVRSISEYNKAVSELLYRQGTILSGIFH